MKNIDSLRNGINGTEKIILDYILKHDCKIQISCCATDLGLSVREIEKVMNLLLSKGVLKIYKRAIDVPSPFDCVYFKKGNCVNVQDNLSVIYRICKNKDKDACCYQCNDRYNCEIACDTLDQNQIHKIPRKETPNAKKDEADHTTRPPLSKEPHRRLETQNHKISATTRKLANSAPVDSRQSKGKNECGNCSLFLLSKCPRKYPNGNEVWRSQLPCNLFRERKTRPR